MNHPCPRCTNQSMTSLARDYLWCKLCGVVIDEKSELMFVPDLAKVHFDSLQKDEV
jgi:hypothetical protein